MHQYHYAAHQHPHDLYSPASFSFGIAFSIHPLINQGWLIFKYPGDVRIAPTLRTDLASSGLGTIRTENYQAIVMASGDVVYCRKF
jgi:hypothetical protein